MTNVRRLKFDETLARFQAINTTKQRLKKMAYYQGATHLRRRFTEQLINTRCPTDRTISMK